MAPKGAQRPSTRRSRRVVDSQPTTSANGRHISRSKVLPAHQVRKQMRLAEAAAQEQAAFVNPIARPPSPDSAHRSMSPPPAPFDVYSDDAEGLRRVVDGDERMETSAAGGEFAEVFHSLTDGFEFLVRKP